MDQRLLGPLSALEASLNNLVQALTTTNTYAGAPKAGRDLVTADDNLTGALIELKQHQDNYAEILRLRAEKDALEQKLKNTVFEAHRLRKAFGDIHPSILESSDEEEETEKQYKPVDYQTLLAFATRIGKQNAIAAQQAEQETQRQYVEAKKKRDEEKDKARPRSTLNGSHTGNEAHADTGPSRPTTGEDVTTQEIQTRTQMIKNTREWQMAMRSAPFPNAEDLRKGALGRIQLVKEADGEEAMDLYVEKLVRDSEMKQPKPATPAVPEPAPAHTRPLEAERTTQARPQQAVLPPRPRKKIDLDFPEEDDEEED